MIPDSDVVAAIVREVAEREIQPRFGRLADDEIKQKSGPLDLVTLADIEAEKALTRRLTEVFPGTVAFGEEAATADPGLFGLLGGEKPVWVLDPVDGTINFAQGRPDFAVIVAYIRNGATLAGWIYAPVSGTMIQATRNRGAWCGRERLLGAASPSLARMTGSAYGYGIDRRYLSDSLEESGSVGRIDNRLCGAVEYMELVRRQRDFMLSRNSLPWDHAAGILIAEEAGGAAAFLDGSPYDPRILDGRILITADRSAWSPLQAAIRPLAG